MTNNQTSKTVAELASFVAGKIEGDPDLLITGFTSLENAGEGDVAFVEDPGRLEDAAASRASCVLVPLGHGLQGKTTIEVKQPKFAFAKIATVLRPAIQRTAGVDSSAIVASAEVSIDAFIGPRVYIGEGSFVGKETQILNGAYIGQGVRIGAGCLVHPGVVIYDNVTIGDRVILHAGVVIGADGFGYVRGPEGYIKFPQVGTVEIEDDVEIGALSCIDRGALGRTRIGRGTKIDNLVQIGHNVDIGERVVIAAQTGISGSTIVEDDAIIGGQVGMGDHARVQSGAIIGSKAGILPGKIVRPGVWWGIPVQPLDEYKRLNAHVNRLPQLREEVKELKRQMAELMKKQAG